MSSVACAARLAGGLPVRGHTPGFARQRRPLHTTPHPTTAPAIRVLAPATAVVAAGVVAAVHVGKLPPAIPALQQALGLSLVQAGFMLSLVQLAGMIAGIVLGTLADLLGQRRSMLLGLALLGSASVCGGAVASLVPLLVLRALEGLGFMLVVLPAPALLRSLLPPLRLPFWLGLWSAYMPTATALSLLIGPLWLAHLSWRSWWWLLGGLTLAAAALLAAAVPAATGHGSAARLAAPPGHGGLGRLTQTLSASGPWLVAACFCVYAGQWLAVIGFLPTMYAQAGIGASATGAMTAGVAAVNIVGNLAAGRALQRGLPAAALLAGGALVMGLGTIAAFGTLDGQMLPLPLRFGALLLFSAFGGLIPGTLFSLAVRLAPAEHLVSSTVGWMQQGSAIGQFAGPPLVAWVAARVGGWHWTWAVTASGAAVGMLLAAAVAKRLARPARQPPQAAAVRR